MDKHSSEARSFNMSQIKNKDTKPEILVRKYLFSKGLRYRKYDKKLPGHPDIVLAKYHTVIFVNGCFWHGHENCKYAILPKTNTDFWKDKILNNIARDKKQQKELELAGWHVIIVWTCELRKNYSEQTLNRIYLDVISH